MPGNFKREDLRVTKTYKSLVKSMRELLSRQKFEKITVNDLCNEALISRVTFYSHFSDKYALLEYTLGEIKKEIEAEAEREGDADMAIYRFLEENSETVTNLTRYDNRHLSELLHGFISSTIKKIIMTESAGKMKETQVVLSNFCAAGILNHLKLHHTDNRTGCKRQETNLYVLEMLRAIIEWDTRKSRQGIQEEPLSEQR